VFSEADVKNVYDVRRRMDLEDNTMEGVAEIAPAQIEAVMSDPSWEFMADQINEPGLKIIADLVDQL
jgi:hypothetical protein